jgi:hypothetical protein
MSINKQRLDQFIAWAEVNNVWDPSPSPWIPITFNIGPQSASASNSSAALPLSAPKCGNFYIMEVTFSDEGSTLDVTYHLESYGFYAPRPPGLPLDHPPIKHAFMLVSWRNLNFLAKSESELHTFLSRTVLTINLQVASSAITNYRVRPRPSQPGMSYDFIYDCLSRNLRRKH